MKCAWILVAGSVLFLSLPTVADDDCPKTVKATVEKAFPGASMKKCSMETHDGKQTYEVKLKTKEGYTTKMDLDPAGLVLLTQQYIAVEGVPTVVVKSFKTKYPDDKIVKTEKWSYPDGKVTYRVTYAAKDGVKKSVVYTNEGAYVEEVEIVGDDDMD